MKRFLFVVAAVLLLGCGSLIAQAPQVSIPIVNGDFENVTFTNAGPINDPAGCGTGQNFDGIPGWTFVHINPGSGGGVATWKCDDGMPNSNVADLCCGEGMFQLTTEKARQGTYVIGTDVANWFYPYPGDLKIEAFQAVYVASCPTGGRCLTEYGTNKIILLSPAPFCSQSFWNVGDMRRKTVVCDMPGYFLQTTSPDPLSVGGQNPGGFILIFFTNGVANPALGGHAGWPVIIDNVTLTFTPAS